MAPVAATKQAEVTKDAVPQDAIVVRQDTPLILAPVMDIALAKQRLAEFQDFVRGYLVEDEDFGTIPGTPKPTLYKPGADKLCELYALADSYRIIGQVEDFGAVPPLFDYTIECSLHRGDRLVSTGLGSCNSYEGKYRWRDAQRVCPACQKATIIKGKSEYGGGWLCWTKKDGCGAKFAEGDQRIEGQASGKVTNDDVPTLKNTILKMAKKRAKIDATLAATRSSGIFTQDMEDVVPEQPEAKAAPAVQQPQRASARTAAPQPGKTISEAQSKKLWATAREAGWREDEVKSLIKRYGFEHTKDISVGDFDGILADLSQGVSV
jgi:hypothetical protein